MSTPDASGATKYYRSHYNQWCWSDIYTGPTSCLIVPQTFSSFVFFIRHLYLSIARLFTERSLLYIMSRHTPYWIPYTPYCWLATSLFWYSARLSFLKHFWKMIYPTYKTRNNRSVQETCMREAYAKYLYISKAYICHVYTSLIV